jgi:hypothetical protein
MGCCSRHEQFIRTRWRQQVLHHKTHLMSREFYSQLRPILQTQILAILFVHQSISFFISNGSFTGINNRIGDALRHLCPIYPSCIGLDQSTKEKWSRRMSDFRNLNLLQIANILGQVANFKEAQVG